MEITEKDLIGRIAGIPLEVVKLMMHYQVLQGNPESVEVFQLRLDAPKDRGGFMWSATAEGTPFWSKIINNHDYSVFFKKYPIKVGNEPLFTEVGISEEVIDETIAALPKLGDVIYVKSGTDSMCKRVFIAYKEGAAEPVMTVTAKVWKAIQAGQRVRFAINCFEEYALIPEEVMIELTLEDISKGKGKGVPPHLIHIING